jgi:hypothetical protein
MISLDAAELALHEKREGVIAHTLIWVTARNRDTQADETMGLWTGEDARVFDIGGARTYYGPAVIDHDPIDGGVGLDVRTIQVRVPGIAPEVEQLIRGYDPKFGLAEMHVAVFNPETMELIAPPRRVFKGWIDQVSVPTPPAGGTSDATLTLASAARALTRIFPLRRGHADQQDVLANDRGREYSAVVGLREIPWGEGKVRNTGYRASSPSSTAAGSTGGALSQFRPESDWGP